MKLRMKTTRLGSLDGSTTTTYREGVEYEFEEKGRPFELAIVFVGEGWAYEVRPGQEPAPEPVPEAPPAKKGRR